MTTTLDSRPGLSIHEVAERSGLSEATLRYYERIGLIAPVPRDESSRHRRYPPGAVERIEALACLRATGMSIEALRAYLAGLDLGRGAAADMVSLFAEHARVLDDELRAVRLRHAYVAAKVALWRSRVDDDPVAEAEAAASAQELAGRLQRGGRTRA